MGLNNLIVDYLGFKQIGISFNFDTFSLELLIVKFYLNPNVLT